MNEKRILTIQDISCVGQCSLTVALPIISACGIETAVIPSAVLSTHTAWKSGWTFRDLTEDIPAIQRHWESISMKFDALYTGYLGNSNQIAYVEAILKSLIHEKGLKIVDPVMADNGKLYSGFDSVYVEKMQGLCAVADIILPNITEACLLVGEPYRSEYDESYILNLLEKLSALGPKIVVLTGVGYRKGQTGVSVYEQGKCFHYEHKKVGKGCHGTGDVYASSFVGSMLNGKTPIESAKIAADFTVACIENTIGDKDHWYGVKFEPILSQLIQAVFTK